MIYPGFFTNLRVILRQTCFFEFGTTKSARPSSEYKIPPPARPGAKWQRFQTLSLTGDARPFLWNSILFPRRLKPMRSQWPKWLTEIRTNANLKAETDMILKFA